MWTHNLAKKESFNYKINDKKNVEYLFSTQINFVVKSYTWKTNKQ